MKERSIASQTLDEMAAAGFDKASCRVAYDELYELQAENFEINLLRTNFETDISLTGICDQRRASLSFNKTDDVAVGNAVNDLRSMLEGSNQDQAFGIAEEQPHEQFAVGPSEPDYDAMYDRIQEVHDYASSVYPKLNLRTANVTFVKRRSCYLNTNNVDFELERGSYRVSLSFASKDGTDTSSMMYTGYTRFNLDDAIHESTNVDTLLRQSVEQLKTQHVPAKFVGDLVIAPTCLQNFIGFLTARISDGPMISGTSVFKDKLGDKVASGSLTLHSNPVGEELTSGYWITSDGYKAENNTIVENGVLKSYLLGLYGANRTGLTRAVNSGGCYVMDAGDQSYDELIADVEEGILINRFSAGRPSDRGDFSGLAKNSYYIKDGKIQFPIRETTVSGNMVELLQSIEAVSKERLDSGASILPWVRVSGVTAS